MEIVPDPVHALLLMLPFGVAAFAVWQILWKPLLAYLDEREETSARARHEAHELDVAAERQLEKIEARLAEARAAVSVTRQQARARALAREAEIVAEARAASDRRLGEAMEELGQARTEATGTLQVTASELSSQIATQILGRQVG